MIVLFFLIYSYTWHLLKTFSSKKIIQNEEVKDSFCLKIESFLKQIQVESSKTLFENGCVKFYPAAFIQRYVAVSDVISFYNKKFNGCIKKVVDIGCSEMAFFSYVKSMDGVEEYLGVDIDKPKLERFYCRVKPYLGDFLSKRSLPLSVEVLSGCITKPDRRLKNANVVIAIELIEHLSPPILEDLPYSVFGVIQPNIAIFTTPNGDFNILFPHFLRLRHLDHKFEWSREEFEAWCQNLCVRYPSYSVTLRGIGASPSGTEYLGHSSQMAVFCRTSRDNTLSDEFCDCYETIFKDDYPYETSEEKYNNLIEYEVRSFINRVTADYTCTAEEDTLELPLNQILKNISIDTTVEQLRDVLVNSMFQEVTVINSEPTLLLSIFEDSSRESVDDVDFDMPSYHKQSDNEDFLDLEVWSENMKIVNVDPSEIEVNSESWYSGEVEEHSNGVIVANDMTSTHFNDGTIKLDSELGENGIKSLIDKSKTKIDSTIILPPVNSSSDPTNIAGPSGISLTSNGFSTSHLDSSLCREESIIDLVSCQHDRGRSAHKFISEKQANNIVKCHSLENIANCIDILSSNKHLSFRYSLNIDKKVDYCDTNVDDMELDSCMRGSSIPSLTDSKAIDSGYPNSCQDMDLDLTPEQVDEIISENDSSLEEGESSAEEAVIEVVQGNNVPVILVDNVENGDVANNNRDDEGNNWEIDGEEMRFEVVVAEGGDADAAAGREQHPQQDPCSDDEGFYISVLDMSSDTLVAEDTSNSTFDELGVGYSSFLEIPSVSIFEPDEIEDVYVPFQEFVFPEWLLSILIDDVEEGGGDVSPQEEMALLGDVSVESELVEEVATVSGDSKGGGEPISDE